MSSWYSLPKKGRTKLWRLEIGNKQKIKTLFGGYTFGRGVGNYSSSLLFFASQGPGPGLFKLSMAIVHIGHSLRWPHGRQQQQLYFTPLQSSDIQSQPSIHNTMFLVVFLRSVVSKAINCIKFPCIYKYIYMMQRAVTNY